jgi:hypothetical protein
MRIPRSLIGVLCVFALAARAGEPELGAAVPADVLEQLRGGFTTPAGLSVSLGIERLVAINGDVVGVTSLHVADLSRITPGEALAVQDALSRTTLIQNGVNNHAPMGNLPGALVLQNSLNDQLIRSQTTINTTVNSAALLRTMNSLEALRTLPFIGSGPR